MTILRRTMLAGGVNEKFLPDSQKLIYIASTKVNPKKGSLGSQVVLNKFNEADGHGIIATSKDITEIKDSAFEKSDQLLEVILPEGLMSIGKYAFKSCGGLSSIRIPISISDIKQYAFDNIAYNTSVYISDLSAWCKINFEYCANPLSTGKLYLNNEEITELVIPSDITQIKRYTFKSCSSLINVILHDQVTTIGSSAFQNCKNLTSINIPNGVTTIGSSAFQSCINLTSINIPNGVTSIGNDAFAYCSSLPSITIPNSVTSINWGAFSDCTNLKSVHISDLSAWCNIDFGSSSGSNPLSQGGKLYLNNEEITELVIPSDITQIKSHTFRGYAELIEVTLHDNIESIGDHSFSGCTNLTSINIPDSVKRIYNGAFAGCTNLTSINIPDSVVSLQESVFYNCGFNSFIFPKSISYVNSSLFEECKNLIKITFPSNITYIYDKAFYYCTSLGVCDFSAQTSVPSANGYHTFTSVPNTCKFVVPDHLYDEWITSYIWDDYADQIIKKSEYDLIARIQHIDGQLYTESEWVQLGFTGDLANGISVNTSKGNFIIAKTAIDDVWSTPVQYVSGAKLISSSMEAKTDTSGISNTEAIVNNTKSGAAHTCSEYKFPNGAKGYLPALGEWYSVRPFVLEINKLLELVGGEPLSQIHWSSTQQASNYA